MLKVVWNYNFINTVTEIFSDKPGKISFFLLIAFLEISFWQALSKFKLLFVFSTSDLLVFVKLNTDVLMMLSCLSNISVPIYT